MTTPKSGASGGGTPASHFTDGGDLYAAFRPTYPASLAAALAAVAPARHRAVDVGCGTGQLSTLLAADFDQVIASDISADQIANATPHERISYHVASASEMPVEDSSVDLITVAQAAHWLDLEPFYAEVRRVAAPGAVLALISYGVMTVEGPLSRRFEAFYWDEIHTYWPPERHHVESGYRALPFPFEPLARPELSIDREWDLDALLGYIETWSATKASRRAGAGTLIERFEADARKVWEDRGTRYPVTWPLSLRLGRINSLD